MCWVKRCRYRISCKIHEFSFLSVFPPPEQCLQQWNDASWSWRSMHGGWTDSKPGGANRSQGLSVLSLPRDILHQINATKVVQSRPLYSPLAKVCESSFPKTQGNSCSREIQRKERKDWKKISHLGFKKSEVLSDKIFCNHTPDLHVHGKFHKILWHFSPNIWLCIHCNQSKIIAI